MKITIAPVPVCDLHEEQTCFLTDEKGTTYKAMVKSHYPDFKLVVVDAMSSKCVGVGDKVKVHCQEKVQLPPENYTKEIVPVDSVQLGEYFLLEANDGYFMLFTTTYKHLLADPVKEYLQLDDGMMRIENSYFYRNPLVRVIDRTKVKLVVTL